MDLQLLILAFLSGVLTVAAPCSLALLPTILGGSLVENDPKKSYIIIASLGVSILIFTLLLRTALTSIFVDPVLIRTISGALVLIVGATYLFPHLWDSISVKFGFNLSSAKLLSKSSQKSGVYRDVLLGASLGPVFSSCSPTYAILIATILPQDLPTGIFLLIVHILGLTSVLALVVLFGRKITSKMKIISDPSGKFKKVLGILLILVGLAVMTGFDKTIEKWLIERGYLGSTNLEIELVNDLEN